MTLRASVDRTYIAIDLKSFYASVECKERNRDPLLLQILWWQIKQEQKKQFVLLFHLLLKVMEYRGGHGFLRLFKR